MFDAYWQKYVGSTRIKNVTQTDALQAQRAIDSAYGFMIGADIVLMIAAGVILLQPIIAEKFKK